MNIYSIFTIWVIGVILLAIKNIRYALAVGLVLPLLIPPIVKFPYFIPLNTYNIIIFILLIFSIPHIKKTPCSYKLKSYLINFSLYIVITSTIASIGNFTLSEQIKNLTLFFAEYLLLTYCFLYIKFDKKSITFFNYSLVAAIIVIFIYGVINYITKINLYITFLTNLVGSDDMASMFQNEERGIIEGRISSTFIHPLLLGQMMLLCFSYLFYQLKDKINKLLYFLILIAIAILCFLCGSRSAFFPLFFVITVYLVYCIKLKKIIKYLAGVFIGLLLISPFLSDEATDTFKSMIFIWDQKASEKIDIKGSSIEGRKSQLDAAFNLIQGNPILGNGIGFVQKYGADNDDLLGAESIILQKLVDNGILGLFVYFIFYFYSFKYVYKKCKTNFQKASVVSLSGSYFFSLLTNGVGYSSFTYYGILLLLTYNVINIQKKGNHEINDLYTSI